MNRRDIIDLMGSDMKLWDTAETEDLGGGRVVKTLDLPLGIGKYSVTLEGMKDAGKRRDAVGSYGAHIRGLIKERIDDEAVTARAKVAAAKAEQANSESRLRDDIAGVPVTNSTKETSSDAEGTHAEDAEEYADLGTTLAARAAEIHGRIKRVEANLARWYREQEALTAALNALGESDDDTPQNSKTQSPSPASKTQTPRSE